MNDIGTLYEIGHELMEAAIYLAHLEILQDHFPPQAIVLEAKFSGDDFCGFKAFDNKLVPVLADKSLPGWAGVDPEEETEDDHMFSVYEDSFFTPSRYIFSKLDIPTSLERIKALLW